MYKVLDQIKTCRNLITQADVLFSCSGQMTKLAKEVERSEKLIAGGFRNMQQFTILGDDTAAEDEKPLVKFVRGMSQLTDEFTGLLANISQFKYRTKEEIQDAHNEVWENCIKRLREIAPFWPDFLHHVSTTPESAMYFRLFGIRLGDQPAHDDQDQEEDSDEESLWESIDFLSDQPGIAYQRMVMLSVVEAIELIRSGATDAEVAEAFAEYDAPATEIVQSKSFALDGLESAIQHGNTQYVRNFHTLISAQNVANKDWEGHARYLDNLFK